MENLEREDVTSIIAFTLLHCGLGAVKMFVDLIIRTEND